MRQAFPTLVAASLLCSLFASSRVEAMAVWPGGPWDALMAGGGDYTDDVGDENPDTTDIVGGLDGGVSYTAAFFQQSVDDDQISFRIRLDADGSSSNRVWQVLFETDGDASTIDWVLELRQSGAPSGKQVIFTQASTGGSTYADVALSQTYSWTGAIPDWTRWVGVTDGSTFDNDADFFLDIAMPLSTFQSVTGLSHLDAFQMAVASSSSHTGINKDTPLGLDTSDPVSAGWGDVILLMPEPGTHVLVALGLCVLASIRTRARRRALR